MPRQRRRGGHGVLFGALQTRPGVNVGVEIDDDPHVGGWVELELTDHQPRRSRGGWPMDAIERITGVIVAHRGDVGRAELDAHALDRTTWQLTGHATETRQGDGTRVDDHGGAVGQFAAHPKNAEGVTAGDPHRSQGESATTGAD